MFLKLELCIIGNKLKIMKRSSLTVLFFVAFSLSYCQKWEMKDFGNAFDGIVKMCAVEALETTPEGIMLGVVNDFAEIKLSRGYGEDGFMNNLHIRLLVDESYFNKSERVEKILMSFDRDKDVYEIGRLYQVAIGQPIDIDCAFLGKYSKCFNKVDICNLFKLKRQVNFRMYTENGYHDISFPLAGSTVAIEKTYKIPKYIRKGDWTDFAIEAILFTGLMSKANDGEDNISFAASNCLKYLKSQFGEYYFLLVNDVKVENSNGEQMIYFHDVNGIEIANVGFDVAFKNVFFVSGNIKRYEDSKIQKDVESIELYYGVLCQRGYLDSTQTAIDQFVNFSEPDLKRVYSRLKADSNNLEIFRDFSKYFVFYTEEEYTFEVFTEPWGK